MADIEVELRALADARLQKAFMAATEQTLTAEAAKQTILELALLEQLSRRLHAKSRMED
jgi:hypothetical protein